MPFVHSQIIEVRNTPKKGRGVFAKEDIAEGVIIERVPILLVTWDEIADSELADYAFVYNTKKAAVALGYGSMYNHSYNPNARYDDVGRKAKVFSAIRDIKKGEEITVNYNGDPDNDDDVEFHVVD